MKKLKPEDLLFWRDNSYLVLKDMFAHKVDDISNWVNDISSWPVDMSKWLNFYEMNNSSVLSRIENFVPHHSQLASILMDESLLNIVSELMGEQAVLYKDRINFKPPGGGGRMQLTKME